MRHPLPTRTCWLAAIVIVVLVTPTALAANVHADLEADRIQGQGMVDGAAPLTALLFPYETAEAQIPRFSLTALQATVETDYANTSVVVSEASFNSHVLPQTRTTHHANATILGEPAHVGDRFSVFPSDPLGARVRSSSSCFSQGPSDADEVRQEALVRDQADRPDTVIDVSEATRWGSCDSESTVQITGDFWFSAWGINLDVQDSEGHHAYWSGHYDDQAVTKDQELYVYVTNGTLTMPLPPDAGEALFVGHSNINVTGSLQFSNAHGTLTTPAGDIQVGGEPVTLEGTLRVGAEKRGDALQVALSGQSGGAVIQGTNVVFPDRAGTQPGAGWMMFFGALLVVVAALAVWYGSIEYRYRRLVLDGRVVDGHRGRRGAVYAYRADRAWKRGQNHRTVWWASLALHRQDRADLRQRRAEANAELGRYKAALSDHDALDDLLDSSRERAYNACLAARSATKMQDHDAARAWSEMALELSDAIFLVESVDPAFDDLKSTAWFQSLIQRANAQVRGVH